MTHPLLHVHIVIILSKEVGVITGYYHITKPRKNVCKPVST